MRSSVDLPQPDGPTNTTNSPSATSRSTPWMTVVVAEALDDVAQLERWPWASRHFTPADAMPVVMWRCRNANTTRDRQQRDHRHREQVVPLRGQLALERVERELQREVLGARQHDQRPQEVVPAPHHREDREHRERRRRQRQDDAPEDAPLARVVHARRVDQLVGNRQHVLAQQEHAGRRRHRRPDHAPQAVEQPELRRRPGSSAPG